MTSGHNPLYLKKPDIFTIAWMTLVHIFAIVALFHFTWSAFFSFVSLHFMTSCLGITFCFHRLLSHKSFKAHPLVAGFTALCGTLALQGTAEEWVSHHRLHHRASDTVRDPHNARLGFWHSHMGWLFLRHDVEAREQLFAKYGRDIVASPWIHFLSKPPVMIGCQLILALALFALGGAAWVYWGIFFRLAAVYHITWFVNSATHKWGYRNFEADDLAKNNWWVAILSWGEGWHNNHHRYPNVCSTRYRWWELDITYLIIKALSWIGLTSEARLYPANAQPLPARQPRPSARRGQQLAVQRLAQQSGSQAVRPQTY